MSLIAPDDHPAMWAIIAGGAWLAIWLEQRYRWAMRLSGPVIALLLAMILSNTAIVAPSSPAADFVEQWLVPLAIPLLLARANIREIVRTGRGLLIAFILAALGTLLGTVVAVWTMRGALGSPNAEHAAGLMAASYIGGGVNFFMIKSTYNVDSNLTTPLLVADNFIMAGFFIALITIAGSRWFRARYPHPHSQNADTSSAENLAAKHWRRKEIALLDIAQTFTFAFITMALAFALQRAIAAGFAQVPRTNTAMQIVASLCTNKFVLLTTISLLLATSLAKPLAKINGPEEIGAYLLMLFLFCIGLPANLMTVIANAPELFLFCTIIAVTNVALPLIVGRWLRLNLEELVLAMNATLGGPPTAAAMAISAGWPRLVLPGLLIGLLGYAVGTPLGILMVELLRP
jgi:uncharacterized membrane protein